MDKLQKQLSDFERAMRSFEEAIELANEKRGDELYPFIRDSAIQRFEFTFEIFWKMVKTAMEELEGAECSSPKSCMRELFKNHYVDELEVKELFKMVDDRKLTAHTYLEPVAERIFGKLGFYAELMKKVAQRIKNVKDEASF